MRMSTIGVLSAAFLGAAAPAHAGTIVVSGDATVAARIATAVSTGNPALAGNIAFAQNLLGGGDTASIYRFSVVNSFPNPPLGDQLATAYNTLPGVTATTFTTGITSSVLNGADLLVILGRDDAFTVAEVALVHSFLVDGGNVFLAGESANIGATANNVLNGLLTGIGSTIRLGQATQGIGDQFATGGEILADPLTAGVTSFGYGRTTTVSGGRTLFLNDDGNPFIAAELIEAVPEPATWALMLLGFGAIGYAARRRPATTRFGRAA